MRQRFKPRNSRTKAGFTTMTLLVAGLAFSCAPKLHVKSAAVRPEPESAEFLFSHRKRCQQCGSRKDAVLARVGEQAGLNQREVGKLSRMKTKTYKVRAGDSLSIWPGEEPVKVTDITPKKIRFSDGTKLSCGENYLYIDVKLHVLVSNMSTDRSVTIIVAKDK